jgi:hypothetical protein
LRFEEFVRGVDRLKAEGKDEINHLEDYELLAITGHFQESESGKF